MPALIATRRRTLVTGLIAAGIAVLAWGQADVGREEELETIRGEIARLQVALERSRRDAHGLEGQLAETRIELELQESRIAEAVAAGNLAEEQTAALEQRIEGLEGELTEARTDLKGRLLGLYRLGRGGYVRAILSVDAGHELFSAIRQLRYLARRDRQAIDRYLDLRAELALEEDELQDSRARAREWLATEEERRSGLVALESRQTMLLARLEAETRTLESQASKLQEKERKLSRFLDFLYGRSVGGPQTGTPIQEFRGVLDWPVDGRVVQGFGTRRDPQYKTEVPHNGLEVATSVGEEVRVVFSGRVVFAAPFAGYGNTVVVLHSDRVFTLYAGLSEVWVAPETEVRVGAVLGRASERLYFEIRVHNAPVDPIGWLR